MIKNCSIGVFLAWYPGSADREKITEGIFTPKATVSSLALV